MIAIAAEDARRFLAEEIRVTANIRSPRIVDALATVPRERFLPPGPWQIRGIGDAAGGPRWTEDADPRHVYHDLAVAIDPARNLFNGQPSLIARWLDDAGLDAGQRAVHIGCGTGYFTALIAHVVGPSGVVDVPGMPAGIGKGMMLLVTRRGDAWSARAQATMPVAIYSLKELRDEQLGAALGRAMMSGGLLKVTRIRRDAHEPGGECIIHGGTNCLSA